MTDPLESEYLQNRAYKPAGGDGRLVAIPQPTAQAMALYEALTAVREAEEALAAAQARTPDYTAQYRGIDFYGAEQTALNQAINDLARVWLVQDPAALALERTRGRLGKDHELEY